jgi:hypothetical protein
LKTSKASSHRNLLIGTGEGILAMPWNFLSLPGNFVIAALLTHSLAAGAGITAYRVGWVIKPRAVLVGLCLLRGLREPQRSTQPTLTGAFRTIRQLVAAQGASFLGRGG